MDIKLIVESTIKAQGIPSSVSKAENSENVNSNKEEAMNPNETTDAKKMFQPVGTSKNSPTSITKAQDSDKGNGYFNDTGITPDQQHVNQIQEAEQTKHTKVPAGQHEAPTYKDGTIKPKNGGWDKPEDSEDAKKYPAPEGINENSSAASIACGVISGIMGKQQG